MDQQIQIPWRKEDDWQMALASIAQVRKIHGTAFKDTVNLSNQIRDLYRSISSRMEEICAETCPACTDICCIHATIWYDFKDLLFLSFSGDWQPKAQITRRTDKTGKKSCCHLGQQGCLLERSQRPFVCTWYLCPSQARFINRTNTEFLKSVGPELSKLKTLRKKMEEAFIQIPLL